MSLGTARQELLEQFARIGKAVSNAGRLELLDLLAQGEKSVEVLARQSGLSVTNTSNHLKELRTSGLVATSKEGPYVYYRLTDPAVYDFLRCLQEIARRQLAEVRQIVRDYFEESDALEPVGASELFERMHADDVVVLDVRPEDEYTSGHIPGAISIPVGELERRLSELPPEKEIVAYCRGPYCVLAPRALEILRSRGFRARRLEEGMPDWRARGLDVAAGTRARTDRRTGRVRETLHRPG
ncbi:MAG TPA: metalloregulator ArsR/SmtB family transcription factor [Gemmatimonadaceae bacterium]|nr:metalloregulator ArsR/SmtB family transcription factor [Gemmatimonadaceae bacterium]